VKEIITQEESTGTVFHQGKLFRTPNRSMRNNIWIHQMLKKFWAIKNPS